MFGILKKIDYFKKFVGDQHLANPDALKKFLIRRNLEW